MFKNFKVLISEYICFLLSIIDREWFGFNNEGIARMDNIIFGPMF